MTEDQYRLQFKKQLENLKNLCDDRNKYHLLYKNTSPGSTERENAKFMYDNSVLKLKEGHQGMNATIGALISAWETRTEERPIDRFWEDFEKNIMSKWDDTVSNHFCKIFSEYLISHPEWDV